MISFELFLRKNRSTTTVRENWARCLRLFFSLRSDSYTCFLLTHVYLVTEARKNEIFIISCRVESSLPFSVSHHPRARASSFHRWTIHSRLKKKGDTWTRIRSYSFDWTKHELLANDYNANMCNCLYWCWHLLSHSLTSESTCESASGVRRKKSNT